MADVIRREELEAAFGREQHRLSLAGTFIGAFASLGLGILFITLGVAAGIVRLGVGASQGGGAGGGVWILVSVFVATYIGAAIGVRSSGITYKRDGGTQGMVTWALSFFLSMVFISFVGAAAVTSAAAAGGGGGGVAGSGPAWWFFIAACAGLLGGFLGGVSGAPLSQSEQKAEARRHPSLREREV
ncbi:MAG TPA: hypothetical protein VN033_06935 [Vulgatibacter sp.]|nr:hypothetical protein [Vulgatibacter sp.]